MTELTTKLQRVYYLAKKLDAVTDYSDDSADETREKVAQIRDANLVSSELANGQHAPALDIDLPCQLIESTTPGHFHLYIDKPMDWKQYEKLLKALGEAGILEPGYVSASIKRKGSFLRTPWTKKKFGGKSL